MKSKYEGLSKKNPKEAADIVGGIEKRNYLAHTIRDIEFAILRTQSKHYQIITYTSETNPKSNIIFYDNCCEIKLTCNCEKTDDRVIRLILAHELGHLVNNIDKLKNPQLLNDIIPSDNEEIYAWQFAYYLIDKKSIEHKEDIQHRKFVYGSGELRRSLEAILADRKPEIRDAVIKSLQGL